MRDFECPRYLWTPKVGKNFVGCKSTNPVELLTNQKGQAGLSLGLLGFKEAENLIESNICPLTKYYAKVGAKQNQENYHYREVVRAGLEAEGWNIIERFPGDSEELKAVWEERKEIKQSSVKEENLAKVNAKDLTPEAAIKLESKGQ